MNWLYSLPAELWERLTSDAAVAIPFFVLVAISAVLLAVGLLSEPRAHRAPSVHEGDAAESSAPIARERQVSGSGLLDL